MSENSDSNHVLEGSGGAAENGDPGLDHEKEIEAKLSESEHMPLIQIHVPIEEESNGFMHSEPKPIAVAYVGESLHQESSSLQVGHVGHLDESVQGDSDDARVTDDAGKEDMFEDAPDFVDASDELSVYDGRSSDTVKPLLVTTENQESSEEEHYIQENRFPELNNGVQGYQLMDELERLRAMLEKTVGEKEVLARENKEEREIFAKDLANLCHQLKALTDQQSLPGENDGGLVDRLHKEEIGEREEKTQVAEIPLHVMMNECSQSLESALQDRLQTEGTLRELHAILYMKDQEIEDLNAKVTELSVSRDVVDSYLMSIHNISLGVQFEKDQHVDTVINRMLSSLSTVVNQEELLDDSVTGKISHVEKSTFLLVENYNLFLSEIDQLRQCLTEPESGQGVQEDFGTVFVAARDELLELRRKEADFVEKLSHLEGENRKLVEQLDKEKGILEMMNAELGKTKMELEQEKTRCANVKEKLTLAVTKGKALVQQQDSLKQSLAEKTGELEKCLVELQEKSSALEAAELSKEELVRSENLSASLQEALSQRDMILEQFEEILSQTSIPEGLHSVDMTDRIRWLLNDRNALEGISLEFHKLRDALSLINLPETVLSLDLESQVGWLGESFYHCKDEIIKLQDDIARTREAAQNEIDRLTTSLLAEIQEKYYLQLELDDLTFKYEGIVEKEHQVSLEKDKIVKMLLKASGITLDYQEGFYEPSVDIPMLDYQEGVYQPSVDMPMLIDRCLGKMKEQSSASFESSRVDEEIFERILTLLYIRDQELMLSEKLLEEEMLERSEVSNLLNELRVASQELLVLKEEKDSLQKDLNRSEEKSTLLREKLSMAVKKGKGLVQERENLRSLLDEKNKEIEKLKLDLQQQESLFDDCRDQNIRLSTDVERIPKLEEDLVALKDQRDQLEKFLVESNNMLQRVIGSIDGIVLPVDSVFEEPVEKVKWLGGYISECQVAKTHAEQELGKEKEEVSTLATKLAEAHTTIKSLEDAWSAAENNISRLAEEKREVEVGKTYVEQELQKAIEEVHSQTSKFAEVCVTRKSLEDALSLAEQNLSLLINEKEDAQVGRGAAETELEKVKEEVSIQTSKLAEAYVTIKTLEGTLSQLETNIALLTEENNNSQVGRINLENELKNLKDEASSQAGNLADANTTIKSLEDALLKAENNISVLVGEKKMAEEELSTLNSKLSACMEDLSGTHGSLKGRSVEFIGQLNDLQVLMKDETLSSLLRQSFEKNFQRLKDMDLTLKSMRDHFIARGSEALQNHLVIEEDSSVRKLLSDGLDNTVNIEMDNGEVIAADIDDISSHFIKIKEALHLRNKFLADKFEGFSSLMDEFTASLLRKLQATRDEVIVIFENMESLTQKVKDMEMYRQGQENTIAVLENDIRTLLSACTDATKELQFEVQNKLLELNSVPQLEKLDHTMFPEAREVGNDAIAEDQQSLEGSKYVKAAEKLLFATRKVQTLTKQYESTRNVLAATVEDLQNKLKEAKTIYEKAMEERDRNQNMVFKLETDLQASQNVCSELGLELEGYQAKEDKLKEREAEVSSLYNTLSLKEREAEDPLLSASQVKSLFDRISRIEVPFAESEVGDLELHNSAHVKKLFYIIDSVTDLQHKMNLLSHEKEKLQSTLETQVLEIEHLKEEVVKQTGHKQDTEKMRSEISELALGLENVIHKLGGNDVVGDQNPASVKGLLPVLEKLVMALILELDNSKSKAQELGAKLLGSQKVVDDLLIKVKLLEESLQGRTAPLAEIVQERSIFEAPTLPTGSEISEIEDVGSLGKNAVPPVPPAAHVRTMRKGSTDHLALNIDSESDRLISNEEKGEDKGHVFKSLNNSGLIPKQGKMIADRIDGIWVSGGRVLMSRPQARLGLIAYSLFLHIWLLGTIL